MKHKEVKKTTDLDESKKFRTHKIELWTKLIVKYCDPNVIYIGTQNIFLRLHNLYVSNIFVKVHLYFSYIFKYSGLVLICKAPLSKTNLAPPHKNYLSFATRLSL